MPKTKFQDFIFTVMMVIVMVYVMVCYNIAINLGEMSNKVFFMAFGELPLMCVIAFVAEFFAIGRLAQKITFKHFNPEHTNPLIITLSISAITVVFMCPLMSLAASLLFNYSGVGNIFSTFINICVRNFPMALCWQIFYAGPLVRTVFRFIFRKQQ